MNNEHVITPVFLSHFCRYVCVDCHNWIRYDEATGKWSHVKEVNGL